MTPLAASIAQNLVAAYRHRGLTVSIAGVVEAALEYVAVAGVLPGVVAGMADIAEESPSRSPDHPSEQAPFGEGPDVVKIAPAASARKLRLPRVLVSLSDVGMSFLRTIGGLIPFSQMEAATLDSGKPPLAYADLLAKAEGAGARAAGRPIPSVVKLAISIRAGGRCEARGCASPIDEFDHLDPYSETRMHLPGRMAGLCGQCHRARHDGLIANPADPPDQWRYIVVGAPRRSREVDWKVQACRLRVRNEQFELATVSSRLQD